MILLGDFLFNNLFGLQEPAPLYWRVAYKGSWLGHVKLTTGAYVPGGESEWDAICVANDAIAFRNPGRYVDHSVLEVDFVGSLEEMEFANEFRAEQSAKNQEG